MLTIPFIDIIMILIIRFKMPAKRKGRKMGKTNKVLNNKYSISSFESERMQILKVIFTVMVVFLHSYTEEVHFSDAEIVLQNSAWFDWVQFVISQVISRCAVPGFFFLSAVLLYRKDFSWADNLKKKCKTLVVPYLILNTMWILIFILFQNIGSLGSFFVNSDRLILNWSALDWLRYYTAEPYLYTLWFLRDLFVLNCLTKVIKALIDRFPKIIFAALLVLLFISDDIDLYIVQKNALIFFSFGYYFVKYDKHFADIDKLNVFLLTAVYAVSAAAACLIRDTKFFYIALNISIISGLLLLVRLTAYFKQGKIKKAFIRLSGFSFFIYLFHEFNLTCLKKLMYKLLPANNIVQLVQYFAIPCIIIICCVVLAMILKKFTPRIYSLLTGNRKL